MRFRFDWYITDFSLPFSKGTVLSCKFEACGNHNAFRHNAPLGETFSQAVQTGRDSRSCCCDSRGKKNKEKQVKGSYRQSLQ